MRSMKTYHRDYNVEGAFIDQNVMSFSFNYNFTAFSQKLYEPFKKFRIALSSKYFKFIKRFQCEFIAF